MLTTIGRVAAALLLAVLVATPAPATAQEQGTELRVVTRVLSPLVVEKDGEFTGFSIDLWNKVAERLNLRSRYHVAPDVRALLEDVRVGKADIGVAAVSITSAREMEFDFSQPILNAGLQIMVRGRGPAGEAHPVAELLALLTSPVLLVWLGVAFLLILIPAHIVWFLERRQKDGMIPTSKYFPGIFYALYWAAATLATQADESPRQWLARIIAILWMFTGVVFVAFYTAQLAASLTVQQIQGSITGPDDLRGKRVGTTRGSTAAGVLREMGADVHEVGRIEEAFAELDKGRIDAVVFDAPVLLYYAASAGKGRVNLVGPPFRKEDYGFVFPRGGNLRKSVDIALLSLREDGTYQQLYEKWFVSK